MRRISKRRKYRIRKVKRERIKILSRVLITISLLIALVIIVNVPLLIIPLGEEYGSINYEIKYDLIITLTWFRYREEAKYLGGNISAISISTIIDNTSKTIAVIPFKPGKTFTIGHSVSYRLTTHELPVKLFIEENLSKIRFPLAVISSYKKVLLPLSTYYFESMFEAYMIAHEASINISSSKPLLLKLVLHKLDRNETRVLGPFMGSNVFVKLNETFLYMDLEPYVVMYGLVFKVVENSAVLYPLDNLALFSMLAVTPMFVYLIIRVVYAKKT